MNKLIIGDEFSINYSIVLMKQTAKEIGYDEKIFGHRNNIRLFIIQSNKY